MKRFSNDIQQHYLMKEYINAYSENSEADFVRDLYMEGQIAVDGGDIPVGRGQTYCPRDTSGFDPF